MTKSTSQKQEAEAAIRVRYQALKDSLTERSRRLFAASEALAFGYGGVSAVSRATGISTATIRKGLNESHAIESGTLEPLAKERSRRPGGGRKRATDKDPTLLSDLKELVEAATRGDPESPLLWTARSLRNLARAMSERGHQVKKNAIARLLKQLGYSLQGNKKRLEGAQHPDRNAQFEHINELVRRHLEASEPAISVDTKKKELVGSYKNAGRELRPTHDPELDMRPKNWLLRIFRAVRKRSSGGIDDALTQELEARPPVHLALHHLQPRNLTFYLPRAPR